jgi:hypothetical protein
VTLYSQDRSRSWLFSPPQKFGSQWKIESQIWIQKTVVHLVCLQELKQIPTILQTLSLWGYASVCTLARRVWFLVQRGWSLPFFKTWLWVSEWVNEWVSELVNYLMNMWMSEWVNEWINEWMIWLDLKLLPKDTLHWQCYRFLTAIQI